MSDSLNFQVNEQTYTESISPGTSLLSLLRNLGWYGVHRVCESGDCGACTVWVDDKPIHSCIYPAMRIEEKSVTTIEGLATDGKLSPMQSAFLEKQGFQCGFCTPGVIMSAEKVNCKSETEIRSALRGNLCRCTGYQAIIESILLGRKAEPCEVRDQVLHGHEAKGQVGESIAKQDGIEIVTGKPVYTADYTPAGLLHLKVLRSPHPHARIRKIRTDKAKAIPGVHAIFTHEDVPRIPYTTAGHADPQPDPLDHYLLDNKVRFVGDRVAAVVAETVAIAEQACQLIEVDYEILPHIIDPEQAMERNAVVIHDEPESCQIPERDRNIAGKVILEKGNIEQGFAAADLIIENTYNLPAVQHVHLEPHISTSWLDEDGTLVIRSSTQVPFHCQTLLSKIFDLPKDKIRVFKAKIGGGFGNKQEILTEDLCAFVTLKTGRPVQWEFTRTEEFTATNSRHAMKIQLKTGVKLDGTIVAQDMAAISNTGAYGNHATTVVYLTGCFPLGLYRCANQKFVGHAVYTNTMPAGAFRGYGATQGSFAVESQLDEIAQRLNIDPLELRLKNIISADDVLTLGSKGDDHFHVVGSYGIVECFDKVSQALGYISGMQPIVNGHLRRGFGFAVGMQASGLAKIHTACVKISLKTDGKFELRTGSIDVGTGSDTTLRQIAAQVLGVSIADIELIAGDTQTTPYDSGSYASATIYISGQAVNLAAQKLRDKILELAAQILRSPQLIIADNKVKSPTAEISLLEIAQQAENLSAESEYAADKCSMTFAVQGVEVEVDTETGHIKVLRSIQAIDIGKAINPRICEGQAIGGMIMGLGYALSEELRIDEQGKILNPRLRTYQLPTALDVPAMQVFLVEKADPNGPFGAKGIGEIGANCTAPAIANAIAHATGIRLTQLPMTPERVWRHLKRSLFSIRE
ncbi:molybdopterin-dependent oxidoreductase [Argonema antarcticum]|uniref:molybdopterin-dependent oxidoreductase n=1 Tax=Argonema antarcticum TaxID=2942763 RepID=UPI002012F752|nr:molybdopterin cofactor-binding domain-containing protein [Argonema antarcticum]MCL1471451.1 molybdopterin-dependent oxidoreductase [Argonema antarcticum A004/B2]